MTTTGATSKGIVTLANDAVAESLIALLASIAEHEPHLPVTVIPFDDDLAATRRVVARYGHSLYSGPLLARMDELGRRYWPEESTLPHNMRKFCAFWCGYDAFFYLDADCVLLAPIDPYFVALAERDADFLYFHPDAENCYRPGRFRDVFTRRFDSVGFNGGAFLSRGNALSAETVAARVDSAAAPRARGDFKDNLEQSFLNYCVDRGRLRKLSWADAVPDRTAASALMLVRRRGGHMVLEDARTPDSGRQVALLHWAGYHVGPFMPYRRTFLRYRLGRDASRSAIARYQLRSLLRSAGRFSPRVARSAAHKLKFQIVNWLAARGLVSWPR